MSVIIGPYTIARGEILPADRESTTPQEVVVAGDGSVHVSDSNYDEHFIEMTLRDDITQLTNVVNYLRNGVRYRAIPFLVTDGFGTQYLVRYWDKKLRWKHPGAGLIELVLTLRVEV